MIKLPAHIRCADFDYSTAVEILTELFLIILISSLLYTVGFGLFHFSIELFNVGVSFFIFVISYYTFNVISNPTLTLIGLPYFYVGIFILINIVFACNIVPFHESANIRLQFFLTGKFIEAVSLFFIVVFVSRKGKISDKFKLLMIPLSIFSIFACVSILYWRIFPRCIGTSGAGTLFRTYCEVFLTVIFISTLLILILWPLDSHKEISFCIIAALFLKVISQIFFLEMRDLTDRFSVIGHMMQFLSYFFIYKALLIGGLKNPFKLLFCNLNQSKDSLQDYTLKLTETNRELASEALNRQKAESQLRSSADLLRGIIVSIPAGIFVVDTYMRAVVWNRRMEEMTGIKEADMLGHKLNELCPAFFNDEIECKYVKLLEKCSSFTRDRIAYHDYVKCDKEFFINIRGNGYTDLSGNVQGLVVVVEDVTDQVCMERTIADNERSILESRELEKLRAEFYSNISHELRTPVNVIMSSLQLLGGIVV